MHLLRVQLDPEEFPAPCYPFCIPALRQTHEIEFCQSVTFFVGENGSGKSTLLEAIGRRSGLGIWDKPKRHLAHENPYEDRLGDYVKLTWADGPVPGSIFRAETFHDWADFLDDVALCDPGRLAYHGGKLLNRLSHGEAMLSYFNGRYESQAKGLYLLDEPEAALSPSSQIKFLQLLARLSCKPGSQFIVATHSPILLSCPNAQIFSFETRGIRQVAYEETEHYQVYREFFTKLEAPCHL